MCFSGRSGGKQKCIICILFCLSFIGWVPWADMLEKQRVSSSQTGETEALQRR